MLGEETERRGRNPSGQCETNGLLHPNGVALWSVNVSKLDPSAPFCHSLTMSIAERVRKLFKEKPRTPSEIAEIVYEGKATVTQIRYVYAVLNASSPDYWAHREKESRKRSRMAASK